MFYLDNSATTPIDPEVLDAMMPYLKEEFGNPSSRHYTLAVNAEKAVAKARQQVADLINCRPEEIIFTSCASESNNMIIKGVSDYLKMYQNKGNHIITSSIEHKSVLNPCKFLNGEIYTNKDKKRMGKPIPQPKVNRGYNVTFLPVNEKGQVSLDDLSNSINDQTILTSIMWANNEIGNLNKINEIGNILKDKNILFHSDATQVLGKINIDVSKTPVDFLSFSAHKLYGPKGIGAAFIKKNKTLPEMTALLHGGSQENGYRAGTHAVHNIVGFGKACEIAKRDLNKNIEHLNMLTTEFKKILLDKYPDITFLNDLKEISIPGVVSVFIPDIINEMYISNLSNKLAVSAGSACSLGEPSFVINAIGKSNMTSKFLRFSFNKFNALKDLEKIKELI
ncbi:cysteine desulfurase family protein [Clostridium thermobutyricum]|uniref:cysteine desulfurase family protein n=1 Tax=Clostridium thermobutyricum TaxID=29372 RepID=UPI003F51F83E